MRKKDYTLCLLIFLLSFLIFVPSLRNGFVWDDEIIIQYELTGKKTITDLFKPYIGGNYLRPVSGLSFIFDHTIWYDNATGYHLTNVLIHSISSMLVFVLIRLLGLPTTIAFVISILFALHPVHAESVAWVSGRTDILSTMFFLLSFIAYIKYRESGEIKAIIAASIFFLFSVLSKEIGISLILIILAYELMLIRHKDSSSLSQTGIPEKSTLVIVASAYIIPLVIYTVLRMLSITPENVTRPFMKFSTPLADGIVSSFIAFGFYIKSFLYPYPPHTFIGNVPDSLFYFIAGIMFIITSLYIIIRSFPTGQLKDIAFWIFFTIVTLSPSIVVLFIPNISNTPLSERYIYLPSIGLCAMTVLTYRKLTADIFKRNHLVNPVRRLRLLTGRLTRGINPVFAQKGKLFSSPLQAKLEVFFGRCSCRDDNRGSFNNELLTGQAAGHSNGVKIISVILVVSVAGIYSYQAIQRSMLWEDNKVFWGSIVDGSNHWAPFLGYGRALGMEGKSEDAKRYLMAAYVNGGNGIREPKAVILSNLGLIHIVANDYKKAEEYLEQAIKTMPRFTAYNSLGVLYIRLSEEEFNKSGRYNNAHLRKAESFLESALRMNPDYLHAHYNLGIIYYRLGMIDKSKDEFSRVIEIDPRSKLAHTSASFLLEIEIKSIKSKETSRL
ncbi:MAG: tetratricopeptide repeat protein [Nitrospirota bacterium]